MERQGKIEKKIWSGRVKDSSELLRQFLFIEIRLSRERAGGGRRDRL